MATEPSPGEPDLQAEAELDEASITSSLARLQEVHIALRKLRETIPRVMDSVLVDPPAPEQLHLQFAQAAKAVASDLKAFARTMEDPHNKEALEKAKESRAKNAENITSWQVTEHEDWLDVKNHNVDETLDLQGRDVEDNPITELKVEDVQSGLDKFKASHPIIEASVEETSKVIKMYLPAPAHINFEIQHKPTEQGKEVYIVHTKEKTKLHKAILEAVARRPRPNDLELLLEMLASYADLKTRPCVKCNRLLDRNAQFPVERSAKRVQQAEARYPFTWEGFHAACT